MIKKKVVFFEITGKGTGSSNSLKAILSLLERDHFEVALWFGNKGNQAAWKNEVIYESKVGGLRNFDFFPACFQFFWIKHFLGFLAKSIRDIFCVPLILKRLAPDLLHLNSGHGLVVGIWAKLMGIPVVWHIRELVCENWIGRLQDRLYAYCSDQIIAISDVVASRLPYSSKCRKVVRMYNAVGPMPSVDADQVEVFRKELNLKNEYLTVLLLGNICLQKGYGFLAEVADQLVGKPIQFVLAGRIPDKPTKEQLGIIKSWEPHTSKGNAVFSGHVDAATAIAAADLVVCPNLVKEPLGRTVLEAYMLKKPVLASEMPAFTETIVDGKTGWLLPPDADIWAEKLMELSSNRSALEGCLGEIQKQLEKFNDQQYIRDLESIYENCFSIQKS